MPASSTETTAVDPAVWRTAWTVLVGGLAVLFDTTIVAVSLNTLASDLHVSVDTIQWVSTGYLLALGITIPIAGWAQRSLGGKRLWLLALGLFLISSILSSLAWSATSLIAFRVLQGVAGGFLMPLMSTLVMQAAGGRGLGKIMSVVGLPAVLGPILGPVVGGLLLQHLHWSWMFWINVPFCIAGLALGVIFLPSDGPTKKSPLDVIGFALMASALVSVLWALSNAGLPGAFGRADVFWPLLAGVILLAGFIVWTLRRRMHPLLDLKLLKHWPLASSALLLFLSGITLYGAMVLIPLYFQHLRGATVFEAGLLLIPQGVGTLMSRFFSGRLSDTMGSRALAVAGFVIVVAGTVPFALAGADANLWLLLGALFVRGFGLGTVTVPLMALGFRGLAKHEVPDASIITRIAQQVGGAFGTAVLAVILTGALTAAGSTTALTGAFHQSFWWATGFTVVGALISFALPGKPVPPSRTTAVADTKTPSPAAR